MNNKNTIAFYLCRRLLKLELCLKIYTNLLSQSLHFSQLIVWLSKSGFLVSAEEHKYAFCLGNDSGI